MNSFQMFGLSVHWPTVAALLAIVGSAAILFTTGTRIDEDMPLIALIVFLAGVGMIILALWILQNM